MFVRQLIGQQAGQIIEMPYHVAQACLSNGTVQSVTDAEVVQAGLTPPEPPPVEAAPLVPHGYEAISRLDGQGYDLFKQPVLRNERGDITSPAINPTPLHNLAALRDYVAQVVEGGGKEPPKDPADVVIPEGWEALKADEMKALAKALGADPAPTNKGEASAFIAQVATARAEAAKTAQPPQDPANQTPQA